MSTFTQFKYEGLNHLQVGRIGEYWAKIWLTLHNYDVYTTEVDNKGIDFIVRKDDERHIDIQVKTMRGETSYIFVTKETWKSGLRDNLYLMLIQLKDKELPTIFLIPSTVWLSPNALFKEGNYQEKGLKSKDEWGINISKKNMDLLNAYEISRYLNGPDSGLFKR